MSTLMRYHPVSNFRILRVTCKNKDCGMVLELPAVRIVEVFKGNGATCPLCHRPFNASEVQGGADAVTQLAKACIALDDLADKVGVEFPVHESPA